jgi:hypothetical protein
MLLKVAALVKDTNPMCCIRSEVVPKLLHCRTEGGVFISKYGLENVAQKNWVKFAWKVPNYAVFPWENLAFSILVWLYCYLLMSLLD